jgi:hypothetical protein
MERKTVSSTSPELLQHAVTAAIRAGDISKGIATEWHRCEQLESNKNILFY